jgi:uncharacterized protein with HEPN domain
LLSDAVIRNFEVIGEATKKVSDDFNLIHSNLEWKKMAGMRDKLIHDYIGGRFWAVWRVVEDILPKLKDQIEEIINKNPI